MVYHACARNPASTRSPASLRHNGLRVQYIEQTAYQETEPSFRLSVVTLLSSSMKVCMAQPTITSRRRGRLMTDQSAKMMIVSLKDATNS